MTAHCSPATGLPTTKAVRQLFCRKCEGHGQQVILKGHAPVCPYTLCLCASCEKLNNKRLRSFNKRNKEKVQLARAKRRQQDDSYDRRSECSSTDGSSPSTSASSPADFDMSDDSQSSLGACHRNGRSMSLGSMTVMSYDIWKAKCAAEKKKAEQEAARKTSDAMDDIDTPVPRKRAHTMASQPSSGLVNKDIPKFALPMSEKKRKGRYITLPTIPAMSILVDDEDEEEEKKDGVIVSERKESRESGTSKDSASTCSTSPDPVRPTAIVPTTLAEDMARLPTSVLLQHSMQQHLLAQQQQQLEALQSLLLGQAQPALLEQLLQQQRLAQLTQALANNVRLDSQVPLPVTSTPMMPLLPCSVPSTTPTTLLNSLLAQPQPIYSRTH